MAYIDVITLAEAKNTLRVDDTLTEDDAKITRIIGYALAYIELWTNVITFAQAKTYTMVDGCIRVYDYPINSITTPTEADMSNTQKTLYKTFTYGTTTSDLVLNVGHVLPTSVPVDLIDVAHEIIELRYYEQETGKTIAKDLSSTSIDTLNRHKRFLL